MDKIFKGRLDLDGVIANFSRLMCLRLNVPYPSTESFPDLYWIVEKYKGKISYEDVNTKMLDEGFWRDLDPYPWADKLVSIFDQNFDDWIFITKGIRSAGCFSGKYKWIEKHFPNHVDKLFITTTYKKYEVLTSKYDILVDDSSKNIKQWRDKGGKAFRWIELGDEIDKNILNRQLNELEIFIQKNRQKFENTCKSKHDKCLRESGDFGF